jgi:hypothetical protein
MDLNKQIDIVSKLESASDSNEKQYFINKDISAKTLKSLNFTGHVFRKCNFYGSKFFGCTFTNCEFLKCNFKDTDLLAVTFKDCTLSECDFTNAKFQDFLLEGGLKTNCNFTNIDLVNNVVGLTDDENKVISDNSKRERNLNKNINSFLKKLNKIDIANNFVKSKYEYSFEIGDVSLIVVKDEEVGAKTWRIMVLQNGENIISDTVEENISVIDLQNELKNILISATEKLSKTPQINTITNIKDIKEIQSLLNLENPEILDEETEGQSEIAQLREYIDKQFERLFNIINQKLK